MTSDTNQQQLQQSEARVAALEQLLEVHEQAVLQQTAHTEQVQRELDNRNRILRSVLDSMGSGVAVADRDGNFLLFNKEAEQILGIAESTSQPEEWTAHFGLFLPDQETPYPPQQFPLARAIRGETRVTGSPPGRPSAAAGTRSGSSSPVFT